MKVIYMAHPLGNGPDREVNLQNAAAWAAWISVTYRVAVVADWIVLASVLSEYWREHGLKVDLALVERCDEVWLVGGRVSPGMQIESEHAKSKGKPVEDLTRLGYAAPAITRVP